jgi:hypothetical protein
LYAAERLERLALTLDDERSALRLQRVAQWLREQAELVPDGSVG